LPVLGTSAHISCTFSNTFKNYGVRGVLQLCYNSVISVLDNGGDCVRW
jgi:hypothetical protein